MATSLHQAQVQPGLTLVSQLHRIAQLKGYLADYEDAACGALGLRVHLSQMPGEIGATSRFWPRRLSRNGGIQRLRAIAGGTVCLEAWREGSNSGDWSTEVYAPGDWELLCAPTLRLVQWLHGWGGLHPEIELTFQMAVERFRSTGNLALPLREETGGRLCGRCGAEVVNLPEHLHALHNSPRSQMPLAVYVRVRDGQKSVVVEQGQGRQQHMWTVPEELHRPELRDPRFRPGLAHEIDRTFALAGKSRGFPRNGRFPLPDDITSLPHLAHALRRLTRGDGLSGG
jgi:hypothetical protein